MRPAWSVILFSTLSGLGYGLLGWLAALLLMGLSPQQVWPALLIGAGLVTAGLLSSTFHLGQPQRAWRAVTQWRTSWLSREGVAALATYLPMAALAWCFWQGRMEAVDPVAVALLMGCVLTVTCTAMIYASLRTVAAWHRPLVPVVYLAFAAATGGYAAHVIMNDLPEVALWIECGLLLLAWLLKVVYWRGDRHSGSSTASATGLVGQVRPLDPPHTRDNYLLKEMVYQVGRRHGARLRRIALVSGLVIAPVALVAAAFGRFSWAWLELSVELAGLAALLLATLVERWLFFAEARHTVALYYQEPLVPTARKTPAKTG